jgi:hypothetical protein
MCNSLYGIKCTIRDVDIVDYDDVAAITSGFSCDIDWGSSEICFLLFYVFEHPFSELNKSRHSDYKWLSSKHKIFARLG